MTGRHLFNRRILYAFFAIMLLGCFLFVREQEEKKRQYYEENQVSLADWSREYNELIRKLRLVQPSEYMGIRAAYREEHDDKLAGLVAGSLAEDIRYIQGYSVRIEQIIHTADETLSLKMYEDRNSRGYYNIIKTRYDYKQLNSISVVPTMTMGYNQVYGFKTAGFLLLAVGFIVGVLCSNDGKEQLWGFVYSLPGGRLRTGIGNCVFLYLFSFVYTLLFYIALFGISFSIYGGAECVFDTIQSNPEYVSCHWQLNNLEYFLLFTFCVSMAVFIVILLTLLLTAWRRSAAAGVLLMGVLSAVQFYLYNKHGFNGASGIWNVVNIFAFLMPDRILAQYYNIGNARVLVNQEYLIIISLSVITVVCTIGYIVLTTFQKPVAAKRGGRVTGLITKLANYIGGWIACWPLFFRELWRLMWHFAGLPVLLLLIMSVNSSRVYVGVQYSEKEALVLECLDVLRENDEEAASEYLARLEKRLADDYDYYARLAETGEDNLLMEQVGRQIANLEYAVDYAAMLEEYVQRHENENVHYVNQYVYDALLSGQLDRHEQLVWCICLICCFILSAGLFPYDRNKGMKRLYITTFRGRGWLIRVRMAVVIVMCFVISAIVWIMDLKNICSVYDIPLQDFSFSVISVWGLEDCGMNITIGTLWFGIFFLRFILISLFALISMNLSVICKMAGSVAALFAALLPFVLSQLGIGLFDRISCIRIITEKCGLAFMMSRDVVLLFIVFAAVFLVTAGIAKRKWSCIDG